MKNILLVVCTCENNLSKTKFLENILNSYEFKNYYFYHGEGCSLSNRYINLNTSDCYSNLTQKTYKMLDYFKNFKFDYLVKIDDDTFLDINALLKLEVGDADYIGGASSLKNHLDNFDFYKEYLLNRSLKKDINFDYTKNLENFNYILGNFCIFKKSIIKKILQYSKKDKICTRIPQEDISIGYTCKQIKANLLDISENIPFYHIVKNISYHPIPFILLKLFQNSFYKSDRVMLCNRFIALNKYFIKDSNVNSKN